MGNFLPYYMTFIRSHISAFYRFATGGFILSWLLTAVALPVMISLIADSHSVSSIFNVEEGCYEWVMGHQEADNDFQLMDEDNDLHSFHSSCCFDDLALTFKKQEADYDLPIFYINTDINFSLLAEQMARPVTLQEKPLPPPVSAQELRITRLLI